jgi:hypothetical protein
LHNALSNIYPQIWKSGRKRALQICNNLKKLCNIDGLEKPLVECNPKVLALNRNAENSSGQVGPIGPGDIDSTSRVDHADAGVYLKKAYNYRLERRSRDLLVVT